MNHRTNSQKLWHRYKSRPLGMFGLLVLALFFLIALYAPFLASAKPIIVIFDNELYFPLFRYLLSTAYFTKKIDIFFNLLSLLAPIFLATCWMRPEIKTTMRVVLVAIFICGFSYFGFFKTIDPAVSPLLEKQKEEIILQMSADSEDETHPRAPFALPSWDLDLKFMTDYAKLNVVLHQRIIEEQDRTIRKKLGNPIKSPYTAYHIQNTNEELEIEKLKKMVAEKALAYKAARKEESEARNALNAGPKSKAQETLTRLHELESENEEYEMALNHLQYLLEKREWLKNQQAQIVFIVMPLIRNFGWEDDVGGEQALNLQLPFMELSRINRRDLVAGLIFGSRISLFVGVASTLLALLIGIPLGLFSGYYGATLDIMLCRFVEVWESMPVFFMLLLVVAILQTKSIFVVITIISVFSWTSAFRFVRAETFRQRELLYVDATKALGFPDRRILLHHILPNSILAVLALLPFDIMAAITREAGLAFLGLGEEQSCSWGVLMDEGRSVFPAESDLLWPPAIVLTVLLIAVAFVGQALQEAMDPKSE